MNQTYIIIIILFAALIVAGIAASAIQQHNEKKENEKREEINKQRAILDETEVAVAAAVKLKMSNQLIAILRNRTLRALSAIHQQNPSRELKVKVEDLKKAIKEIDTSEAPREPAQFELPKSDKVIIKYIQAIKKLRVILRSEAKQNHISMEQFKVEDSILESLQLRVNIETLSKRANDAIANNMQGSARQYLEKALIALSKQKTTTPYVETKQKELTAVLDSLESKLKSKNVQSVLADKAKDKDKEDIDTLFAPKKKW